MKKINKKRNLFLVVLLLISAITLVGCGGSKKTNNEIYNKVYDVTLNPIDFQDAVSAVYEKCAKGTVGVSNYQYAGLQFQYAGHGSGFIYDGHATLTNGERVSMEESKHLSNVLNYTYRVITNYHVIEGGDNIKIYLGDNYNELNAKILASDRRKDIAILEFESTMFLPVLKLGDSDNVKAGQFAIAIGSPEDYEFFNSLTLGVVSFPNRRVQEDYGSTLYIQTDVAINPGNSGGPLFNIMGEVIGINTMKLVDEEIDLMGFSIPINVVKEYIRVNNL